MFRDAFGNEVAVGDKVIIAHKPHRGGTRLLEGRLMQVRAFVNFRGDTVTRFTVQSPGRIHYLKNLIRVMKAPTK